MPAGMSLPGDRRAKLHATNPVDLLSCGIRRRAEVAGIGRVGALPPERNDERAVRRARDMTLDTVAPRGPSPSCGRPQRHPDQADPRRTSR